MRTPRSSWNESSLVRCTTFIENRTDECIYPTYCHPLGRVIQDTFADLTSDVFEIICVVAVLHLHEKGGILDLVLQFDWKFSH
jgi:hypothetical protein